jgi:hypothetical protein
LNGYQKGKCFYCFGDVSVVEGAVDQADVDHFFPHALKAHRVAEPVDGVWNLVLACQTCNRGAEGKFECIPARRYLERLHKRNEFLINSHHPLRKRSSCRQATPKRYGGTFCKKRTGGLSDCFLSGGGHAMKTPPPSDEAIQ